MTHHSRPTTRAGVLIISQSSSVPFDQRVWLQSQALIGAGYRVFVICPKGPGDRGRQLLDGVRVYRYEAPPAPSNVAGYVLKSAYCWLRAALLTVLVVARDRVSIIQAGGPPDTYWALAVPYRILGIHFVYDQRELSPELFGLRFGPPVRPSARLLHRLLAWMERRSYRAADQVIVSNESARQNALDRGKVPRTQTTVVRSAPDTTQMRPGDAHPQLREGRRYLLVHHGSMDAPDGIELVLRVLDVLVHRFGRDDVHAALLGFGDAYEDLVVLCHALALDDYVTFTGRVGPDAMSRYLSTADVAICSNLVSPLNGVMTMECLSFAVPVIAYDLAETRVTGGDAVEYVAPGPVADPSTADRFAGAVNRLLDDPGRRAEMAIAGRRRAETVLDWRRQAAAYVGVFDTLAHPDATRPGRSVRMRPLRARRDAR